MSDEKFCCEKCGRDIPIDGVGGVGAVAEGLCNDCWLDGLEFDWEAENPDWMFNDPGGESSLYAATAIDPRNQTCPQCRSKNKLTKRDVAANHVCDQCASSNAAGW
jgi:hypothetical protein